MNKLRVFLVICLFSIAYPSFSSDKINFLVSCRDFVHKNDEDNRCKGYTFKTNEHFFTPKEMTLTFEKSPHSAYVATASVVPIKGGIPGFAEENQIHYCGSMFIKNEIDNRTNIACTIKNARGIHWENKTSAVDISVQMYFEMNRHGELDSSCECIGPEP